MKIVMFLVVVALASTVVSFGCTKATTPTDGEPAAEEATGHEGHDHAKTAPAGEVKKEKVEVQGAAVEEVKQEGDKEVVEGEAVEEVKEVPEKN